MKYYIIGTAENKYGYHVLCRQYNNKMYIYLSYCDGYLMNVTSLEYEYCFLTMDLNLLDDDAKEYFVKDVIVPMIYKDLLKDEDENIN